MLERCLDLCKDNIYNAIGIPFAGLALAYHIPVCQSDLDYINNVIRKSKAAELVWPTMNSSIKYRPLRGADATAYYCNAIVLAEYFYADSKCPCGVKNILWALMGQYRSNIIRRVGNLRVLDYRRNYINRWFETCH